MEIAMATPPDFIAFPDDKTVNATSAAEAISATPELVLEAFDQNTNEFLYYVDPITGKEIGNVPPNPGPNVVVYAIYAFSNTAVDYGNSTHSIFIDLTTNPQHGGYAEGDTLTNIYEITGSVFGDVIFFVKGFRPEIEVVHDLGIRARLTLRILCLIAPLGPAA